MKKFFRWICLAAILCALCLALMNLHADTEPVRQADEIINDAVERADKVIDNAVAQADEVIDNAVAQADEVISDAVESAAEGAKQGFIESLKKSASDFWGKLFP